jgi:hypothetical protein
MSALSKQIAAHPFFTADVSAMPIDERVALAYQRGLLMIRSYSMTPLPLLLITCLRAHP